ncbi:MAG TPA: 30S ribosomal protein S4 [Erysipelotrichaceae bacterium]|jgi:small subunit ribosomal protein S4|nr:30S ribosomal protein S4 [Erysipelotrichaceae bacterium]
MARINGPVWKVSRRLQFSILETGEEFAGKRPRTTAPGKAPDSRPAKLTNYGQQLREKQRIRFTYGVNERQFYNTYVKAQHLKGNTGHNFLFLLESRLDNVVYRMSLGRTRRAARQLVNHGHILVNGAKVDIPSYIVKPGSVISVKEASRNVPAIKEALESTVSTKNYVTFDKEAMKGTYVRLPERAELNDVINEALVVEFYNR